MGTWIDLQDEDALAHVQDSESAPDSAASSREAAGPAAHHSPGQSEDPSSSGSPASPASPGSPASPASPGEPFDSTDPAGTAAAATPAGTAAAEKVEGAARWARRARLLSLYYLATPAFLLGDLGLGLNLRVGYLNAYPGLKYLYYGGCFLVGLLSLRRSASFLAAASLVETTLNISLLILSVMIPILQFPMAILAGETPGLPFNPLFFCNFGLAGTFFLVSFYQNPIVRSSPRLDRTPFSHFRLF
jgi:hypothetical protein